MSEQVSQESSAPATEQPGEAAAIAFLKSKNQEANTEGDEGRPILPAVPHGVEQATSPEQPDGSKPEQPPEGQSQDFNPTGQSKSKLDAWGRVTELDKQNRELKQKLKQFEGKVDYRELAKKDLGKTIADLGISFDDLVNHFASGPSVSDDTQASSADRPKPDASTRELDSLKKELHELRSTYEEERNRSAIQSEYNRYTSILEQGGDRWEYVKGKKGDGVVMAMQTAAELYRLDSSKLPDMESVLDAVENWYETKAEEEFNYLKATKKAQKFFGSTPKDDIKTIVKDPIQSKAPPSNATTQEPRELTDEERFNQAVAFLKKKRQESHEES